MTSSSWVSNQSITGTFKTLANLIIETARAQSSGPGCGQQPASGSTTENGLSGGQPAGISPPAARDIETSVCSSAIGTAAVGRPLHGTATIETPVAASTRSASNGSSPTQTAGADRCVQKKSESANPAQLLDSLRWAISHPNSQSYPESDPLTVRYFLEQADRGSAEYIDEPEVTQSFNDDNQSASAPDDSRSVPEPRACRLPGEFVKLGPYAIRPAPGYEVPFGRDYQAVPYESISRLAGYVGLDQYSLYIREVPDMPEYGLRPSRNGVWIKQPHEDEFRRLKPGEADRITPETEIRIGGDGVLPETGLPVRVR